MTKKLACRETRGPVSTSQSFPVSRFRLRGFVLHRKWNFTFLDGLNTRKKNRYRKKCFHSCYQDTVYGLYCIKQIKKICHIHFKTLLWTCEIMALYGAYTWRQVNELSILEITKKECWTWTLLDGYSITHRDFMSSKIWFTLMERMVTDTTTTVIIRVLMSILSTASPSGKLGCNRCRIKCTAD